MNLFLDTEWADADGTRLVSLALISEDGAYVFYAERDPLPEHSTSFVHEVVYPLLERGQWAMQDRAFTRHLRQFLSRIDEPVVWCEEASDLELLKHALGGFDLSDRDAAACGPIPQVRAVQAADGGLLHMMIEDWFDSHPEEKASRHHARVDAQAFRMGWLAAHGKIEPDWSMTWKEFRRARSGDAR